MTRLFAIALLALFAAAASAQPSGMPEWFDASKTGPDGQPVFNAAPIADTTTAEFRVVANYYTVGGNIDDPASSVYMGESPSAGDHARFARETPSYAFLVVAEEEPRAVVSLWQDAADDSFWYMVARLDGTEPALAEAGYTFEQAGTPVLTEVRAMELLERGVDPEAGVVEEGGAVQVVFDGTAHNVLPFAAVFSDVVALVRENELYR